MPHHGGRRERAGRPPGIPNKRHQITRAQIGKDDYLPVEYMLALMRDEEAEPNRRDAMAIQAAPYLHPRLNAVATSSVNSGNGGGDINIVQIVGVPRGSVFDAKTGTISTPGGEVVSDPPELRPYEGSPPLELAAITDQSAPAPLVERLEVTEIDVSNVVRLGRRDDSDEGPGAA